MKTPSRPTRARPGNHVPPRELLWIAPLVAAMLWLLTDPPAWLAALGATLGGLLSALALVGLFLLWGALFKIAAALLFGGSR
ncbi:hypothetical protein JHS3_14020 [Jeongeupia sp. HS-3]|uniref:hypothetical protein n=1 Tax=Jeongeupia sp. HS-3 TaxID=1009682 RepID=UPI0018A55A96|nr:hypothetical protein [Jeongeupia sp. HS-3]BCL75666.1 hypothetical protein JHS3_14020 [Jeongeupia sp. HS-3]